MGKLSRQHMKRCIDRHSDQVAGQAGDMWITMGLYMAEVALANDEGWGKSRLGRLEGEVLALCKVDVIAGADKWTSGYSNNLSHGLTRILDRVEQIHGEGHCAAMREWLKNNGWI